MIDPTGKIVDELRTKAATWPAPFTGCEVRTRQLEAEDTPKTGKAPTIVVLRRQPITRRRREPLAEFLYVADCRHADPRELSILAGLVSDAFHDIGPRVATNGGVRIGLYSSADVGQSGGLTEPDTRWPLERVTLRFIGATRAIT